MSSAGAGRRQRPQRERLREAAVADQGEQIRRGIGDIGPEGENDQDRDVADPPSHVTDHFQRRPVGPVAVIDDEHQRRARFGQRGAQPEDAVGDARRRVRPWHGPPEQEIARLSGRSVEQPSSLILVGIMQRRFQQRADHAVGEVTLLRCGSGRANPMAGTHGVSGRSLDQRRLPQPGRRAHGDDPADAVLQPAQGERQRFQFARRVRSDRPRRNEHRRRAVRCRSLALRPAASPPRCPA